jgi:hypothetical protein
MAQTIATNAIPHRKWLLLWMVVSNGVYSFWMHRTITVPFNGGADVPDASLMGYYDYAAAAAATTTTTTDGEDSPITNAAVLLKVWYHDLGTKGRTNGYLVLSILDLFCIIPSYWLVLTTQLVQRQCYPPTVCVALPTIAVAFDLYETLVHMCAVSYYPYSVPYDPILIGSSSATKYKFLYLTLSFLLVLYVTIRRRPTTSTSTTSTTENAFVPTITTTALPTPPTTTDSKKSK